MKITKAHKAWRENQIWLANSRYPKIFYFVKDLSTQHILNILMNVHHLDGWIIDNFKMEIEGRSKGKYKHVKDSV